MHPQQWVMAVVNVVGGIAVLGSYVYSLATHPATRGALWGAVPLGLQPFYTLSMLLAAVGYFPFTIFLLFRIDPDQTRIGGRFGYGWFSVLYVLILFPSALWMPLTFAIMDRWDATLWVTIRIVLGLVAFGSLALLAALLALTPRQPKILYSLAVAGAVAFCVQTALLDACVWPAFFPPGQRPGWHAGAGCKHQHFSCKAKRGIEGDL